MLWALAAAAAVLFPVPEPPAQTQAASIQILASPGIEAPMDVKRTQLAMPLVQAELGMRDKPLPRIVVFLATREAAELEGLPEEARITVTRMRYRNLPLYHVWIVGTPTEEKIVYGIVRAFNREWNLQLEEVAMDSVTLKVCRRLSSTVSAADLRRR